MGPFQRRAIRNAYYDGVIDALERGGPNPGIIEGGRHAREIERGGRQGWYDGRAKRALRAYEFSVREVLRRAELREANERPA